MAHPFIKITLQQRKQQKKPLPQKNYSSSADPNYHHSINIMNSCPLLATEIKRYCVTIELSTEINKHAHYANFKVYKRWYEYS